ncbi:MAG TPA: S41 family peptidase [Gammaproteobacteria bacterium]|nr:S41 family peptidase [Gammaproteobacteria bacterium]
MDRGIGNRFISISIELIEKLYVHLPSKRSMYAVNPIQRLRLLERRLHDMQPAITERQFYNEMLSIFSQMRDLHTSFVLPEPFRSATAYLPFRLEVCISNGQRKYIVSELSTKAPKYPGFERGAEVTHWNGVAIDKAVALNAERESGSNASARLAQGLAAMTIRWLGQSIPPDEDWVDVNYLPAKRRTSTAKVARFVWSVFQQASSGDEHEVARASQRSLHVGMDARGEVERLVRYKLFGRPLGTGRIGRPTAGTDDLPGMASEAFPSCRNVKTPHGTFAYVRIATFNVNDDEAFLRGFIAIIEQLSQDGLILDVRSNLGGLIHAGERLLQLLTPRTIEPCRFHFLNSARTEQITRRRIFRDWNQSIGQAVETGADLSQGLPLLPVTRYNDIGQKYQGPVVLVTDAICYSTTDIFAAGFQDNEIGLVLGVDASTGAGGANVWEYSLISDLVRRRGLLPRSLPGGASFRFAVRRVTRVGRASGLPLEDFGVRPDEFHEFTRNDILNRNVDLIHRAARLLAPLPKQRLNAVSIGNSTFRVECLNIDRVDAYVSGVPISSHKVNGATFEVKMPRFGRELCLQGFRNRSLVAATRVALR